MKQRFSSLDVCVIAHELNQSIVPLRITNIYDLSSRIFLIKLHAPNVREQLIVDSGFRCHLTSFARTTAAAPSAFVQRLRKYLKTRRVTKVSQVGTDRIIELELSDGLYKLYFEFYAGGNIVLTDGERKIIALLRNVSEGEAHQQLRVGLQYDLETRQNFAGVPPLTRERVESGIKAAIERQRSANQPGKKTDKKKDAVRKSLAVSVTEYPPMIIEHGLDVVGFDKEIPLQEVLEQKSVMDKLMEALHEAGKIIKEVTSQATVKGYILAKPMKTSATLTTNAAAAATSNGKPKDGLIYDDFHPFKPHQFTHDSDITFLEFEGFNKTVDEFFSSIEGQRLESKLHEREEAAKKKLEQAHADHEKRIGGLKQTQTLNERRAEAIQGNIEWVEEAKAAVNGLISQGMDWQDIAKLIDNEQKRGNQVAQLIKLPLKLQENTITLLLAEPNIDADEDSEEEVTDSEPSDSEDESYDSAKAKSGAQPEETRLTIDIDLALTAWANAALYFSEKKSAAQKEERTQQASSKALQSAQRKIQLDLSKGLKQEKEVLRPVRKQYWFEKFLYFISNEGYLVLGGKDAQQNELLYRKHLRTGDAYVHAELQGAASVIVKNNPTTPDTPIPPSTLAQAGSLTVCTSQAWDSKAVMGAWWVNADQVSKTAPSGEYLTTGGFMIRGKKNYLPPAQLLLGFAVMFQISDDSKARHVKHRVVETGSMTPKELGAVEDEQQARNAAHQDDHGEDSGEDSEEEFPDAKVETTAEASDEEEDFPDVAVNDQVKTTAESDDEDRTPAANPLQSEGAPLQRVADDGSDTEEELAKIADSLRLENETKTEDASDGDPRASRAHLSAHQRRMQKKGADPRQTSTSQTDSEDEDTASAALTNSTTNPNTQKPLPRGKRGKRKKLATKYADQDDEDRELAMALLGSKTGQEAAKAEAEARRRKKQEEDAAKARRREQHLRVQQAAEQKRRQAVDGSSSGQGPDAEAPDEEAAEDDEEAARLEHLGLDTFIGRPLPGDELLTAIPVCAPWQALSNFKYKVKLQPGATKRGKAVREILSKWDAAGKNPKAVDQSSQDGERIWPREIELIKAWKDVEVVGCLPVKGCRVMMSGGSSGGSGGKGQKGKGKAPGKQRGQKKK